MDRNFVTIIKFLWGAMVIVLMVALYVPCLLLIWPLCKRNRDGSGPYFCWAPVLRDLGDGWLSLYWLKTVRRVRVITSREDAHWNYLPMDSYSEDV